MSGGVAANVAAVLRAALEASFGLSARGVSDAQLVDAAAHAGWEPSAETEALARVVDLLPICESAVFRNPGLWSWLAEAVLPSLVQRALAGGKPARTASLGCSQGQEPFSLAIKLVEAGAALGAPRAHVQRVASVVGIDAAPARIALARSGVLSAWSLDRGRREWVEPYLTPRDNEQVLSKDVQALCRFEVGNLLDVVEGRGPPGVELAQLDLVLCQHVLVYFEEERAREVVHALATRLSPGAVLILAAPEAHLLEHPRLSRFGYVGASRVEARTAPTKLPSRPQTKPPTKLPTQPASESLSSSPRPRQSSPSISAKQAAAPTPVPVAAKALEVARLVAALSSNVARAKLDDAARDAERIFQLEPDNLVSRFILGQALRDVSPVRARALLEELVTLAHDHPADRLVIGADELSVGQMVAAAKHLLDSRFAR